MIDSTASAVDHAPRKISPVSPTGRELINAIIKRAGELGITTDSDLYKEYFKGTPSYSTWIRLRHNTYTGRSENQIKALRPVYARMLNARQIEAPELRQELPPRADFFENETTVAVFRALRTAIAHRQDWRRREKRAVILTAGFGGGKSAICYEACRRHNGIYTSARQSWRLSYFAMLFDLCNAIGLAPSYRTLKSHEHALLTYASNHELFLAIDNANTLGPHGLNLLRDLVCAGPTVLLVAGIDSFLRNLRQVHGDEAGQLNSRAVGIIDAAKPTAADVANMAVGVRFEAASRDAALRLIADSGGSYSGFRLVGDIMDRIRRLGDVTVSMAQVLGAVGTEEARLRVHEQVRIIGSRPGRKRSQQQKESK